MASIEVPCSQDAYIDEYVSEAGVPHPSEAHILFQEFYQYARRGMLNFDLTAYMGGVCTSAKLRVKHGADIYANVTTLQVAVHKATQTWDESTVTWNNKPAIDPTPVAQAPWVSTVEWVEYDITTALNEVLKSGNNYGWMIKLLSESGSGVGRIISEKTSADYPRLILSVINKMSVDFSADVVTGAAPLTVQFTDITTTDPEGGPNTAWGWEFGDGSTSIDRNPLHVYQNPGYFIVALTVSNSVVTQTKRVWKYITATGNAVGVLVETPKNNGFASRVRYNGVSSVVGVMIGVPKVGTKLGTTGLQVDSIIVDILKRNSNFPPRERGGVVNLVDILKGIEGNNVLPYTNFPHRSLLGREDIFKNYATKFVTSSFLGKLLNSNDTLQLTDESWYWIEKFIDDWVDVADSELREGICTRESLEEITLTDEEMLNVIRTYIADYIVRIAIDNKSAKKVIPEALRAERKMEGLDGDGN